MISVVSQKTMVVKTKQILKPNRFRDFCGELKKCGG